MKVFTRLLILIIVIACAIYYFGFGIDDVVNIFNDKINSKNPEQIDNAEDSNRGVAVMPEYGHDVVEEDEGIYNELIRFIIDQKKDRKLAESYRVLDKSMGGELEGRSYIKDNALAVIALVNHKSEESINTSKEILENISNIQNEDGSWYDFYDITGNPVKVSDKEYIECNTSDNAILLYSYAYFAIMTGDTRFKDVMKKSSNFILSRSDDKIGGLYDEEISSKGLRTLKCNIFGYFALREYAMASVNYDYSEYKDKLWRADQVAGWVVNNCLDNGVFLKGYKGDEKITGVDLESQIFGAIFTKASKQAEEVEYELKDFEESLSKLYKELSGMKGYKLDDDSKNNEFIWCEGTCKVPIALLKLGSENNSRNVLDSIKGFHDIVSKSLIPRGIPQSTNIDKEVGTFGLESLSTSAWAAISFQCNSNSIVGKTFFGNEEEVFKRAK